MQSSNKAHLFDSFEVKQYAVQVLILDQHLVAIA